MLSISLISASYLMDESYDVNSSVNNSDGLNTNASNDSVVNEITDTVNITDVITASKQVKLYEDENGELPANVEIVGKNYTMEQLLYMLSKVIVNTDSSINSSSIQVLNNIGFAYSKGNNSAGELDKKDYVDASVSIISFIDLTKQAPNFLMSEKLGNLSFNDTVDGFVRIVNYKSDNNNTLPDSIYFEATVLVENNDLSSSDSSSSSSSASSLSSSYSSSESSSYSSESNSYGHSYSGNGWSLVNSLKSQLSGMTYGVDGDCYSFSQIVYNALESAGYQCGIYQGHSELGNHRVPYVILDGTFYWLETCRAVQGGWGSGTDWTVPYSTWVPEYIYVSS
jgi:hypothetical protein